MPTKFYGAIAIKGGTAGAMDKIVYNTLADGDVCIVTDSAEAFATFRFESSSTTDESSPWTDNKVIEPDDFLDQDGRWVLTDQIFDDITALGDVTISGSLTLTGAFSSAGLTISSGDLTLADSVNIVVDVAPSADHNVSGVCAPFTAGENLVFGDFCYFKADHKMWKLDANDGATMPCIAMAAATISAEASGSFLLTGFARDDTWGWTPGGVLYASETSGRLTQTAPTTSGNLVQSVAVATHLDYIYFRPSFDQVEVT